MRFHSSYRRILTALILAMPKLLLGQSAPFPLYSLDVRTLGSVKERIAAGDTVLIPAYSRLIDEADEALRNTPVSVVEKGQTPPGGSKHDYMSLARYYWPDSTKPDGLPYVSRDGVPNPEINEITDSKNFSTMCASVWKLSLAYFFTGKEKYAAHAAQYVRAWFIDTATAMNPNMRFAQAIKGRRESTFAGIIETRNMYQVIDAIGLIRPSGLWPDEDQQSLQRWMTAYWNWLHTHPNGIQASKTPNNHGVWFDVQRVPIALFLGMIDTARVVMEQAKTERIALQIEPDGSMPKELGRTISNHYTQFTIEAFVLLASFSDASGVDLWNFSTSAGRSIPQTLRFLLPYLRGEKVWSWKNIKPYEWQGMYPLFLRTSVALPNEGFDVVARSLETARSRKDLVHLLIGK